MARKVGVTGLPDFVSTGWRSTAIVRGLVPTTKVMREHDHAAGRERVVARSRNIKPGFFANDSLCELEPLARLLFAGLWTICDRAGRTEDRPARIKIQILPYDNCDVDQLLQQLHARHFIERYEVDGVRLIQVVAWDKHQSPHFKESSSTLPAPVEPGASPVPEAGGTESGPSRAALIPDSLNLIPDSSPLRVERARRATVPPRPADVSSEVWSDFLAHRKAKKATVTETVIKGARAEAAKANLSFQTFLETWVTRGTQGLQADWLTSPNQRGPPRAPTTYERNATILDALGGGPRRRREQQQEREQHHGQRTQSPGLSEVIDVPSRTVE